MSMRRRLAQLPLRNSEAVTNLGKQAIEDPVTREDFESALERVKSSIGKGDLEKYEAWGKEYGKFLEERERSRRPRIAAHTKSSSSFFSGSV